MTDNENLNDDGEKKLSDYAKQRLKFKEELDAKDQQIASLKAEITANKKAYFINTIQGQGYNGDFNEFADKYAENLGIDEMVALFKGTYGAAQPQQQAPSLNEGGSFTMGEIEQQQQQIGPKSVIGTNPIGGDQPKRFEDLSVEEMKAWGRSHPEIMNN